MTGLPFFHQRLRLLEGVRRKLSLVPYVEEGGGDATGDYDAHTEPAHPTEIVVPDQNAPDAGKHDAGVLQVGAD